LLSENLNMFMIGGGIGLVCAGLGAFVDFMVSRRRGAEENHLPGCMLLMTGALGFVGVVMLGVSYLFYQTFSPAFWMGVGVMAGFFLGFTFLFFAALLISSRKGDLLE
jgi:hypothetical protein